MFNINININVGLQAGELEDALVEAEDVFEVAKANARNVDLGERAKRRPPRPARKAKADAEGGQPKGRKAKPTPTPRTLGMYTAQAQAKAASGAPKGGRKRSG